MARASASRRASRAVLAVVLASIGPVPAGAGESGPAANGDVNGDGAIDLADAVYTLDWLFLGGPAPVPLEPAAAAGLPETGQTAQDGFCPGQDGAHETGCPREDRFADNGDGTVTDGCTGLTWQAATADVDGDGQVLTGVDGGDRLSWCDALTYCDALEFAGFDDWRLPDVRELQSLADYGRNAPAIDPVFSAEIATYWSSTGASGSTPNLAWGVDFTTGAVARNGRFVLLHVRAVRGGIREPREE